MLQRFDLVGFDPRGVGLSTPVECIPDELKEEIVAAEPRPTSDEQLDDAFALAQEVADACAEEYDAAPLGTFNTVDTARDMDRLRQSLGDEQLTYLGYSYGTTLGSTYAELFPDKVRAMVLDAAVDPDADELADAEESAAAFEAGFDAFAANCTGLIAGCPLGAEPRQFVEALLGQAAQTPIPSSEPAAVPSAAAEATPQAPRSPQHPPEPRQATPGVVMTAIQAGLYDTESWPQLAQALAAAQQGDSAGLFSLADSYSGRLEDGTYSNLLDANLAVNCADSEETFEEGEIRELAGEWSPKYPLFGAGFGDQPLHLLRVGGRAHARARAGRRGQRPDPRRRQLRRPGHAAAGRRRPGRGARVRRAAHLAGAGPHGLSQDRLRDGGGQRLSHRPGRPARRPHVPCVSTGAPLR